MSKREILFEPIAGIHPSQKWLIDFPPAGYRFLVRNLPWDVSIDTLTKKGDSSFAAMGPLSRLIPMPIAKACVESKLIHMFRFYRNVDLIYAYNHLVFRKKPWITAPEWFHMWSGFYLPHFFKYKKKIEDALASDFCKGIFVWSEIAKKSVELNLNVRDFIEKLHVVPPAVPKKNLRRTHDSDSIRLLFVGQGSTRSYAEFFYKGGLEVVMAFRELVHKYPDLKLTIEILYHLQ